MSTNASNGYTLCINDSEEYPQKGDMDLQISQTMRGCEGNINKSETITETVSAKNNSNETTILSSKGSNGELNGIEIDSDDEDKVSSNSKSLKCEECGLEYDGFCSKCSMLLRILHNYVEETSKDKITKTIPTNILEIRKKSTHFGVYAMRTIPKDVIFGPFKGLINDFNVIWKMKGGKLVTDENEGWMQYINCVDDVSFQNLIIFQYESALYCRTKREINEDEELLVFYGEEHLQYMNSNVQTYYRPIIEKGFANAFACTYCCLGFVSNVDLIKHKDYCPHRTKHRNPNEEIVQCPICKIHLYEEEYLEFHKTKSCHMRTRIEPAVQENIENVGTSNRRKSNQSDEDTHRTTTPPLNKHLKRDEVDNTREEYQCYHCNQIFNFKTSLIRHIQKDHSKLKQYKCAPCSFSTKSEKSLELHFSSVRHVKRMGLPLRAVLPQVKDYQTCFEAFLQNRN